MSSLSRWDPFRDVTSLRDAMSQLFEQAVLRPGFGSLNGTLMGQMNVIEVEGRYICQIALPGVTPDAVELTVRQNTLTVRASLPETLPAEVVKSATYLLHEFGTGEFSRAVTLPKDVNGDAVQARFERGILTVEIPVAQHAQPKRIAIRETDGAQARQPAIEAEAKTH